jgi:hypothetical protein
MQPREKEFRVNGHDGQDRDPPEAVELWTMG